ncbi:MAG: ribonuclease HI family protein [Elusimicrobia bacterium]|nr:ribonuclease HI family protein [Candidatus Liberimonas magnetica]
MKINIYTDGASRGNPGPGGIGVLLCDENNNVLEESKEFIGEATNNIAEYKALLRGLELAKKYIPCSLEMHLDSELVCKQMLGLYRVRDENLSRYFENAQGILKEFEKVDFKYIPREQNKSADRLANQAINLATAKKNNF